MQRLLYSIFISFFLILSCAKSKPSGVVSQSKITDILTQVTLVDGYLNTLSFDSAKKVMPVLYDKIFKEYGIDSAQFVKNLTYYYGNPDLTESIYKDVSTNLTKYERAISVEDSIRNAFQRDSMQLVSYRQRLYSNLESLKYFNASDTVALDFIERTRRYNSANQLDFINNAIDRNPIRLPSEYKNSVKKISIDNYPTIAIDTVMTDTVLPQFKYMNVLKRLDFLSPTFHYNIFIKEHLSSPNDNKNDVLADSLNNLETPAIANEQPQLESVKKNVNQDSIKEIIRSKREIMRPSNDVKPVL